MTAKEKAKELVENYCQIIFGDEQFVNINKPKQCALMAVDEILSLSFSPYWGLVKKEIGKL